MTAADLSAYVRQCRSCSAPIVWARTITGRSMPIDAEPVEGGYVLVECRQGFLRCTVVDAETAEDYQLAAVRLHKSHFATCPHADSWRHR